MSIFFPVTFSQTCHTRMNQMMNMLLLRFSQFCVIIQLCLLWSNRTLDPIEGTTLSRKFTLVNDMRLYGIEWTNTTINKHHVSTPSIDDTCEKSTWWEILISSIVVDAIISLDLCAYGFICDTAKQNCVCVTERMIIGRMIVRDLYVLFNGVYLIINHLINGVLSQVMWTQIILQEYLLLYCYI